MCAAELADLHIDRRADADPGVVLDAARRRSCMTARRRMTTVRPEHCAPRARPVCADVAAAAA